MTRELRLPQLNRILIAGNCTWDPEVRYTQSGSALTRFGMASTRRYPDAKTPGEWKEDTCFVNVVTWGQLAERLGNTLKKGSAVLVEGRLQSRSWEAEDGQKRTAIEINADRVQVLDRRGTGESSPAYAGAPSESQDEPLPADDLPF